MTEWIVGCIEGKIGVQAIDQWDAWEKVYRPKPIRIGLAVSARRKGAPASEEISIRGVDLAFRYGEYEIAKALDELAVSQGLPSRWNRLLEEAMGGKDGTEED